MSTINVPNIRKSLLYELNLIKYCNDMEILIYVDNHQYELINKIECYYYLKRIFNKVKKELYGNIEISHNDSNKLFIIATLMAHIIKPIRHDENNEMNKIFIILKSISEQKTNDDSEYYPEIVNFVNDYIFRYITSFDEEFHQLQSIY